MDYIAFLGRLAAFARSANLGWLLGLIRDGGDYMCMRIGYLPLRVTIAEGFVIGGFFRHRSFLDHLKHNYEHFTRRLFKESLRRGMIVIDGGAHIGLYTIIASQKIGDEGRILAFEPDPYNFRALLLNLRHNSCDNVIASPKALSASIGKAYFYQSTGTISSSLFRRHELNQNRFNIIEVETTTIDNELAGMNLNEVLVKLDLEGAEPLALKAMRETVNRSRSVTIFAELNPSALTTAGFTPENYIDALRELGLEVFFIDEKSEALIPVEKLPGFKKGNLLAKK